MIKLLTALGAAALAASALAAPAAAAAQDQVQVSYRGLDLSQPADAARFELRLKQAARDVCGEAPPRDLVLSAVVGDCQAKALARAHADVRLALRGGGGQMLTITTE